MSKLIRLGPLVLDLDKISFIFDEIEVTSRNHPENNHEELQIFLDNGRMLPFKDIEIKNAFRNAYYAYKGQPERVMQQKLCVQCQNPTQRGICTCGHNVPYPNSETQSSSPASLSIGEPMRPIPGLPKIDYNRVRNPIKVL